MTNEEKARCIASANQCIDMSGYSSFEECENSALEMAEWKDKQFKEYLVKKKEKMLKKWGILVAAEVSTIDWIIKELFKEE